MVTDDKQQHFYDDEESSIVDRPIPNNTITESLKALVTTLNFIDCWIKIFHHNYEVKWKNFK